MKLWNERWPQSLAEFGELVRLSLVFFSLRIFSPHIRLDRLMRWLHSADRPFPHQPECLTLIQRYLDALIWRFRTNPKGDCLIRSLILFYFARRDGIPVQFHCGVCQDGNALDGHAWLSLHGEPFLEKGNPFTRYVVTYSFPDSRRAGSTSREPDANTGRNAIKPKKPLPRTVEVD